MNYKMEKEIPFRKRKFYLFTDFFEIVWTIFIIKVFGLLGLGLVLLYIILSLLFIKYLYRPSAIKLVSENETLEVVLPFQMPIFIPLESISKIEKTGKLSRSIDYFVIEYDDKKFNTFLMSTELREGLYVFMEELQRRVDNAKSLASINNV